MSELWKWGIAYLILSDLEARAEACREEQRQHELQEKAVAALNRARQARDSERPRTPEELERKRRAQEEWRAREERWQQDQQPGRTSQAGVGKPYTARDVNNAVGDEPSPDDFADEAPAAPAPVDAMSQMSQTAATVQARRSRVGGAPWRR